MTDMQTTDTISYDASPAIELAGRAQQMLDSATDFVIDSPALFDLASDDLRRIKALQKDVEEQRTRITGPLNQAVKAVNDLFRAPRDYLDKAERSLKRSIATWLHEQERQAAEARAQAEAQARAERERLAREEAVARAAIRQAEEKAQAAARAGNMQAATQAMQDMQAAATQAEIAAMTAAVVTVPAAVEAPARAAGISGRVNYAAEVQDMLALVQAVAAGQAPIECVVPDMKFLGAQARAFKRAGPLYPGVVVTAARTIAARAR